jgi:protein-disulfide isomerase
VQAATFSSQQKQEIEQLVRQYLLENPEIIEEAALALRDKREKQAKSARDDAVKTLLPRLIESDLPVLGNPDGDVTILKFSDYQCGYCKAVSEPLLSAVNKDGNIRLLIVEYPILGANSYFAAHAALAAKNQGRFEDMHKALLAHNGQISEKVVERIAQNLGLDFEQMKKDMQGEEITQKLMSNIAIARQLQITGTPAFFVDNDFVGGANLEKVMDLVTQNRHK